MRMFVNMTDSSSSDGANSKMLAIELGELSLYHQRWEYNEPFHLH